MPRILLPIDGSGHALDAVRHLLLLRDQGWPVDEAVLLNVQDPPHLYEVVLAPDADTIREASEAAGLHALQAAGDLLDAAGVPHRGLVVVGDVAPQVIDQADLEGCDLVILAGPGADEQRALWHDSVAQEVVRHARVPVMVVPHPDMAEAIEDGDDGETEAAPEPDAA